MSIRMHLTGLYDWDTKKGNCNPSKLQKKRRYRSQTQLVKEQKYILKKNDILIRNRAHAHESHTTSL